MSATAQRQSGSSRQRSASSLTPKPMWRCSSRATFSMPSRKPGKSRRSSQVARDEVLAGLRERRLDQQVVERDRRGEVRAGRPAAQLRAHRLEPPEHLLEAPGEPRLDRGEPRADVGAADAGDLVHEAAEEDRVARLVHLLGGEEVLLLLERRGVDVGREAVGHRVLAPEEERVVPEGGLALEVREDLLPLAGVLREVDLGGAPVAALPARVQILVADRVCRRPEPVHLYSWEERMYQEGRLGARPSCAPRSRSSASAARTR